MSVADSSFLRRNAFLVAAAVLPVIVILFFLVSTAVPRWLVDAPAHDLLLRAAGPYDHRPPRVAMEFAVREGRLEATFRAVSENEYPPRLALFLFDHQTMEVTEIPVDLPLDLVEGDPPRIVVVPGVEDRRVVAQVTAPDGYAFEAGAGRGAGLVGELFGMRRYRAHVSVAKDGRVVALDLPETFRYNITAIGWLSPVDEGR